MIIKRNFNPIKVVHYVKTKLLFSALVSLGVWWTYTHEIAQVPLPFSIVAILGSALAIFIAFRNNSAYGRWWEARTVWGGIVNSSRVLARLIITFTDSHAHQVNYEHERSEGFKRQLVYICIAWVHALRIQLRNQDTWQELNSFLTESDYSEMVQSQNKPNFLQLLIGKKIYQAMANGTLGGFDSFQMEGQLLALANYQGSCERIKNTPLLRQYDYFTRLFLYVFIFLLPIALIDDFSRIEIAGWMIPVSVLISFVFSIQAKVGEVNEDPFENRITDVPLSALCNTIERDLKEMLGEKELPQKTEVIEGYLF
ncbi:bestrophin family protein [Algoriphagus litoralis]|uniref:bestrophin family protein n=1 Tax=Algoriphagus litoralis TaxID=2202829 RepID=UPI000DB902DC|nr:bestrophin family ion channel [Algoriphagus litoralis]